MEGGEEPSAKMRKVDAGLEQIRENGGGICGLPQEQAGSSSKVPIVVEVSDSSDGDDEEKDPYYYRDCCLCGKEYIHDEAGGGESGCSYHEEGMSDFQFLVSCPFSLNGKEEMYRN